MSKASDYALSQFQPGNIYYENMTYTPPASDDSSSTHWYDYPIDFGKGVLGGIGGIFEGLYNLASNYQEEQMKNLEAYGVQDIRSPEAISQANALASGLHSLSSLSPQSQYSLLEDPGDFIADPAGLAGSMGNLVGSMVVTGGIGGLTRAGLGKVAASVADRAGIGLGEGVLGTALKYTPTLGASTAMGIVDAGSEAGQTKMQALQMGDDIDTANQKASQNFWDNIGYSIATSALDLRALGKAGRSLGLLDNSADDAGKGLLGAIANFGDKVGASKVASLSRRADAFADNHFLPRFAGNIMTTTVPEAYQEGLQNEFQDSALTGDEVNFNPWNMSPESREQMAVAALGMIPLAGVGSLGGARRTLSDMGTELPETAPTESTPTPAGNATTEPTVQQAGTPAPMDDEMSVEDMEAMEAQPVQQTTEGQIVDPNAVSEADFNNRVETLMNNPSETDIAERNLYSNGDESGYSYNQALANAVLEGLDYNPVTDTLTQKNRDDLVGHIIRSPQFPTLTSQEDVAPVMDILAQRQKDYASRVQAQQLMQQMQDVGVTPEQAWIDNANKPIPDSNYFAAQQQAIADQVAANQQTYEENVAKASELIAKDIQEKGTKSDFYVDPSTRKMSAEGMTRMTNLGVSPSDKPVWKATQTESRAAKKAYVAKQKQADAALREEATQSFLKEGKNSPFYTPNGKVEGLKTEFRKQLLARVDGQMSKGLTNIIISRSRRLDQEELKQQERTKKEADKQAKVQKSTADLVAKIRAFNGEKETYGITADEASILGNEKPSDRARVFGASTRERARRAKVAKQEEAVGLIGQGRENLRDIKIADDPIIQTMASHAKDAAGAIAEAQHVRDHFMQYNHGEFNKALRSFTAKFAKPQKAAAREAMVTYLNGMSQKTLNTERAINDINTKMGAKPETTVTEPTVTEPTATTTTDTAPATQTQETTPASTQEIPAPQPQEETTTATQEASTQEAPKTSEQESQKQGKPQKSNQKQAEAIPSEWNTSKDIPQEAKTIMDTGTDDQKASLANRYRKVLSGKRTGTRSNMGVWLDPRGHQNLEAQAQALFPNDKKVQKEIGKINERGAARAIKKIQEAREKGEQIKGFTPEEISTIEKNAKTYLMRPQMVNQLKGITGRSKKPSTIGFWLDPEKYQNLKRQAEKLFDRNDPANKPIFEEVDKNLLTKQSAEGILARIERGKGKLSGYTKDEVETIKKNAERVLNKRTELINVKQDKNGNFTGTLSGLDTKSIGNLEGDDLVDYLSYDAGLDKAGINVDIYEAKKLDNGDVEITYGRPYNEDENVVEGSKKTLGKKTMIGGNRNEAKGTQTKGRIHNIPQQTKGYIRGTRTDVERNLQRESEIRGNNPMGTSGGRDQSLDDNKQAHQRNSNERGGSSIGGTENQGSNRGKGTTSLSGASPEHPRKTNKKRKQTEGRLGLRKIVIQDTSGKTLEPKEYLPIIINSFRGMKTATIRKVANYIEKSQVKIIFQEPRVYDDYSLDGQYTDPIGTICVYGASKDDNGRTLLHETIHGIINTITIEDVINNEWGTPVYRENKNSLTFSFLNTMNLVAKDYDVTLTQSEFKNMLDKRLQENNGNLDETIQDICYRTVDTGNTLEFTSFFGYIYDNWKKDKNARKVMDYLMNSQYNTADEFMVAATIHEINSGAGDNILNFLLNQVTEENNTKTIKFQEDFKKDQGLDSNKKIVEWVDSLDKEEGGEEKRKAKRERKDSSAAYEEKTPKEAAEQQIKDAGIRTPEEISKDAYLYGQLEALTDKAVTKSTDELGALTKEFDTPREVFKRYLPEAMHIYDLAVEATRKMGRTLTEYNKLYRDVFEPLNKAQRDALDRMVLFADDIQRDPIQVIPLPNGANLVLKYGGYYEQFRDNKEAVIRMNELRQSEEFRHVGNAIGQDGDGKRVTIVYGLDEGSKMFRSKKSAEAYAKSQHNETIRQALSELDGKNYTLGQTNPIAEAFMKYRDLMNKVEQDGYDASGRDLRVKHLMGYFPHIHLPYVVYQQNKNGDWEKIDSFHNASEAARLVKKLKKEGKNATFKEMTAIQKAFVNQFVGREDLLTKKQLARLEEEGGLSAVHDYDSMESHNKALKSLFNLFKNDDTGIAINKVLDTLHRIQNSKSKNKTTQLAQLQIKATGLVNKLQKVKKSKETITKAELNYIINNANMHYRFNPHFLKRMGGSGYNRNVREATYDYLVTMANYTSKEKFYEEATATYQDLFHQDITVETDNRLRKFLQQYINAVARPQTITSLDNWMNGFFRDNKVFNSISQKLRGHGMGGHAYTDALRNAMMAQNYLKLGLFNPSSAGVQLTALLNTHAKVGEKYFWRAMKDGFGRNAKNYQGLFDELGIGEDFPTLDKELVGKTPDFLEKKIIAGKSLKDAADKSMMFLKWGDEKARKVTAIAGYLRAKDKWVTLPKDVKEGLLKMETKKWEQAKETAKVRHGEFTAPKPTMKSIKETYAIRAARNLVTDTQFDYSAANNPLIMTKMGQTGKLFLQFRKYPLFMAGMLLHSNWKQRAKLVVPLILLTGMAGIPGEEPIDKSIQALSKLLTDEPWSPNNELRKGLLLWAGDDPSKKAMANNIIYGLPAGLLGVNLSGRIGLSDLIPSEGEALLGPTLGGAVDMATGRGVVRTLMPRVYAISQAVKGEYENTKGEVIAKNNDYERILKVLGFKPVSETNASDTRYVLGQYKKKYNEEKSKARQDYLANPTPENYDALRIYGMTPKEIKAMVKEAKKKNNQSPNAKGLVKKPRTEQDRQLKSLSDQADSYLK